MTNRRGAFHAAKAFALLLLVWPGATFASPVLLAGTGQEEVRITQVLIVRTAQETSVVVASDYTGPRGGRAALILAVPSRTKASSVRILPPAIMNRVLAVGAPRFAEFWERDPCDETDEESRTTDEIGDDATDRTPDEAVPSEPRPTRPSVEFDEHTLALEKTEYRDLFVGSKRALTEWMRTHGVKLPKGGEKALQDYAREGFHFLALTIVVDQARFFDHVSAMLRPIGFTVSGELERVPARLGLPSLAPNHDLYLHVIDEQRISTTNYPIRLGVTNLSVERSVRIHMGKFYNSLYDEFRRRHPYTFLTEYAWPALDCGRPCPTRALGPEDLEVLSGRRIADPDALILSRLHYRHTPGELPFDPRLTRVPPATGGTAPPRGHAGQADRSVKRASHNSFVTRFIHTHSLPQKGTCETNATPIWGGPPVPEPGNPEVFIAENMSRTSRDAYVDATRSDQIRFEQIEGDGPQVLMSDPVPPRASGCQLATPHSERGKSATWMALLAVGLAIRRRRRARSRADDLPHS